jgi:hypothetical protein
LSVRAATAWGCGFNIGGCAMADGVRAVTKVPLYRILFFCLLLLSLLPCCKELLSFRQGLGQVRQCDCFWKEQQRRYPRSWTLVSPSADLLLCGHRDPPSEVVSLHPHSAVKASHCFPFTSTTSTTLQRLDDCILGYSA